MKSPRATRGQRSVLTLGVSLAIGSLALAACGGSTSGAAPRTTAPASQTSSAATEYHSPGWQLVAATAVPIFYYQGLTHDESGHLYFDGIDNGLYVTDDQFQQRAGSSPYIPAAVAKRDKYNHIGAIAFDAKVGVLLPMECYDSKAHLNCANTGAIGVADPDTLAWRYQVKLDPSAIQKAMWAAVSPDGTLLWTSSGNDLQAYRMSDITEAHAWPAHPAIKAVRVLHGAVPPSGVTGGTFYQGRLLLAGSQGDDQQVWSVDVADGSRQLEISRKIVGESEGIDVIDAGAVHRVPPCSQPACAGASKNPVNSYGGLLHWMIMPIPSGDTPATYSFPAILDFVPGSADQVPGGSTTP